MGFSSLFSDGLCGALEMASVDCRNSEASCRTDEWNSMMLKTKIREIRVWIGKACVFKADMNLRPKQVLFWKTPSWCQLQDAPGT